MNIYHELILTTLLVSEFFAVEDQKS